MLAAQYLIKQLQSKWFRKKKIFLNCISSEVSQLMEKIIQGLNFYFLIIFSLQLFFFFFSLLAGILFSFKSRDAANFENSKN